MSRELLLLPPSEGKADGGRAPRPGASPGPFDAELADARASVRRALAGGLRRVSVAKAEKLLGVRGDNLVRARAATDAYVRGDAPVLPAWQRYTGVVWDHAGPWRSAEAKRVLVPSAVYGLATAADPIADYRLKLSVVLPGVGNLARFWKPTVTAALVAHARRRTVVDLLPAEHAAAIDWSLLEAVVPVVHVRFRNAAGDRAVGHDAKAVKGELARCLLGEGLDAVAGFRWQDWHARRADDGHVDVLAPG